MADPPVFEAPASQWPDAASEFDETATTSEPPIAPADDRRLLWGSLGLATVGLLVAVVMIARRI